MPGSCPVAVVALPHTRRRESKSHRHTEMAGSLPNLRESLDLGGFSFDNARRNAVLGSRGVHIPKARKTGTTIVGVCYDGGVVLGADTRATEGDTVADKNCEKIHYIADNIWCCGAGTSADT